MTYGYYIENGIVKIKEDEAGIIRRIFNERLSGKCVLSIADGLFSENIGPFGSSREQAVKKVSAALYNSVYIGDKGLPALIEKETFTAVGRIKGKRTGKPQKCKADELVDPAEKEYVYFDQEELRKKEQEIDSLLDNGRTDEKILREMILNLAAQRYRNITEKAEQ